ncbi:MAG: SGNH/GDSL hydrolase family protein [Bilifractor sp.]
MNQKSTMNKHRTMRRRNRILPVMISVCVVSVLIIIAVVSHLKKSDSSAVAEGTAYLQRLENRDMDQISADVIAVRKKARAEKIASGELSLWAQFEGSVFFGDSRTVGLYYYGFIDQAYVLADAGWTIADLKEKEDEIVAKSPENLFLCTGLNDVSIGLWNTPEEYTSAYDEVVTELMQKLPNTHIYINSIFPAQDPAFEKSEKWREIPEYTKAVKNMCEEKGYTYIDNTEVYEQHKDLYDQDGIHFQKEFYEYWGRNMANALDL